MSQHQLKSGYTTGTCASAAAKAAAIFLLTGTAPETVELTLPSQETCVWHPQLHKPCEQYASGNPPCFRVQKDAGDDPDVTHKTWIYASIAPVSRNQLNLLKTEGKGYWLKDFPNLYLNGGTGIGLVIKPGLSCPVGHYAINPVPRQMILGAVQQVCSRAAYEECLEIQIAIPDGAALAEKTFNPRLGIAGGISVLGTTGIVKPMSEEALLETIRLDIHMKVMAGEREILMAPGNYGEDFLLNHMGVPLGKAVLCSNFVGDAVDMLVSEGVEAVFFAGHIGKLVKVSAGVRNTHSRYGDGRMEQMAALTAAVLAEDNKMQAGELEKQVRLCNTTEEAVGILQKAGLAESVLALAARRVKEQMEAWSGGRVTFRVVTFSAAYGILGKTDR